MLIVECTVNKQLVHFHVQLIFSEFSVHSLDTVQVGVRGLGPANWVARRLVFSLVQENVREYEQI